MDAIDAISIAVVKMAISGFVGLAIGVCAANIFMEYSQITRPSAADVWRTP